MDYDYEDVVRTESKKKHMTRHEPSMEAEDIEDNKMEVEKLQLVDHSEPEVYESLPTGEEKQPREDEVLQIILIIPLLFQYQKYI